MDESADDLSQHEDQEFLTRLPNVYFCCCCFFFNGYILYNNIKLLFISAVLFAFSVAVIDGHFHYRLLWLLLCAAVLLLCLLLSVI